MNTLQGCTCGATNDANHAIGCPLAWHEMQASYSPTRLEYFAAAALTGLLANAGTEYASRSAAADDAVDQAQATIAKLDKVQP